MACSYVSLVVLVYFFFFFFQAEDGIRDYKVTGVQTCALPIYSLVDGCDVRGGEEENPGRVPVQGLDGRPPGAAGLVAVRGRRHRLIHQPVPLRVVVPAVVGAPEPPRRPRLGKARRGRRVRVPPVEPRVESAGAGA